MEASVSVALQITLIGMALVFGAIVLLWGLMALLVRLTPEGTALGSVPEPAVGAAASSPGATARRHERLARLAAAAAVGVALARQPAGAPRAEAVPSPAAVSAWQAAMRASQLKQRGPIR